MLKGCRTVVVGKWPVLDITGVPIIFNLGRLLISGRIMWLLSRNFSMGGGGCNLGPVV